MPTLNLPAATPSRSRSGAWASAALLLLPAGLIGLVAAKGDVKLPPALWAGAGASGIVGLALLRFVAGRALRSPLTGIPAAIAFVGIAIARPVETDVLGPAIAGVLVLMAVGLFGAYALVTSGALTLRRAARLARRVAVKSDWPADLDACRQVPEVKPLREASRDEAAPVLILLADPKPQVRIAALAALEYRRYWRRGQPELVMEIAKTDPLPELRAAAVLALGGVNLRLLLEELALSLRDPSPLVRQAAADALLWDCERRWIWVRHAVHESLADPRHVRDAAMRLSVGSFNEQAVSDLAAWATEAGPLGVRATQTLALHYSQRLSERADPKLIAQLKDHVGSTKASAILRIELAGLLKQYDQFTPELLERLLDATNPSPLRLMAVEELFKRGGRQERANEVLRQIARQPNRELALSAAGVVQKYLQVDLGLAVGEPVPALHTRQAAEVTRRVIQWAEHAPAAPLPPSRISAGLKSSLLAPPPAVAPAPADPLLAPLEWD